MISPRPQSSARAKRVSSGGETPLRQSFAPEDLDAETMEANEHATEDASDDEVIHINPLSRRMSRVDDGPEQEVTEEKEEPADYEDDDENQAAAYSAPILAADEVAKYPEAEYMQPAVPPEWERAPTATYIDSDENNVLRRSGSRSNSRPSSFHASTSGGGLPTVKLMGADEHDHPNAPLEGIHEYEPLFPSDEEDEKKGSSRAKENGNNEKKRKMPHRPRLDAHSHRFPSMDIWEDTPGSLQLQTVVATPQLPDDEDKSLSSVVARKPSSMRAFETPDAEKKRKERVGMTAEDRTSYLPSKTKAMADPRFKPGVLDEMNMQSQQQQQQQPLGRSDGRLRPGLQQRFPSRDVWEDTPDHFRLVTTVGGPQQSEEAQADSLDLKSKSTGATTATAKPGIPPRPSRQKPQQGQEQDTGIKSSPSPAERTQHPALPDRPKPKVPARPANLVSRDSGGEQSPLSRTMSADSSGSNGSGSGPTSSAAAAPQSKPKPSVPPRPAGGVGAAGGVGNKIAALKAGFMSDLNSKLKMGTAAAMAGAVGVGAGAGAGAIAGARSGADGESADSAEDYDDTKVAERAAPPPLDDARKGRAKGPAGRRRAAGAAAMAGAGNEGMAKGKDEEAKMPMPLSMSGMSVIWRIDADGDGIVEVPSMSVPTLPQQKGTGRPGVVDESSGRGLATNTTEKSSTLTTTDNVDSQSSAPAALEPASKSTNMTSTAVQTGQVDISVPAVGVGARDGQGERAGKDGDAEEGATGDTSAAEEKMTVYIGGAAPESGNVVVRHGKGSTEDDAEADDDGGKSSSVKVGDEVVVERDGGEERVVKRAGEGV